MIFISPFKCEKCGSLDVFVAESHDGLGVYCSECNKWIQWITEDEIPKVEWQQKSLEDAYDSYEKMLIEVGYYD